MTSGKIQGIAGLTLEEKKLQNKILILKNANFDDVMRYMKRTSIPCFHVDYTLFKHEPFIRYHRRYYMQEDEKLFKNDIKNISIRMIYQKKKITLQDFLRNPRRTSHSIYKGKRFVCLFIWSREVILYSFILLVYYRQVFLFIKFSKRY